MPLSPCQHAGSRGMRPARPAVRGAMAGRPSAAYHAAPVSGRSPPRAAATPAVSRAACVGKDTDRIVAQTLLERVGTGDAEAVRECIDRFSGLIWALARRSGMAGSEAEDAVQDIFIEIWRSAGRYRPDIASETAFIATIARRRLIDARRRSARRPAAQALQDESPGPPISDRTEVRQEAERAAAALSALSPEQQRVLRLSVFEGLSHEKIATATGLPLGTVKTHARRGLIRIRSMLGAGGTTPGEPGTGAREVAL